MEDDLKFLKIKNNLSFLKMEDNLIFFGKWKITSKNINACLTISSADSVQQRQPDQQNKQKYFGKLKEINLNWL